MTCPEATDRIDDYVDGTLSVAELHEVELHLASCAACAEEERRVRDLVARAAELPQEMIPPRDLWPGIAERIAAVRPGPTPRVVRPLWSWSLPGLAAAAAVVVALGAVLTRLWAPGVPPGTAIEGVHEAAWAEDPGLLAAEQEYARATAQLMAALDARKASLPAEMVTAVEKDLTTIDAALRQVRGALRQDPGNPQLSHMLASTHQKKLDVLQRVVRLSTQL